MKKQRQASVASFQAISSAALSGRFTKVAADMTVSLAIFEVKGVSKAIELPVTLRLPAISFDYQRAPRHRSWKADEAHEEGV